MRKGPWFVKHLVHMHGTRYDVDHARMRFLSSEVDQGRKRIRHWLSLPETAR